MMRFFRATERSQARFGRQAVATLAGALLFAWASFAGPANGQSSPGLAFGQVPTAGQWNSYFAAKQDYLGFTPLGPGNVIGVSPVVVSAGGGTLAISCPGCALIAAQRIKLAGPTPFYVSSTGNVANDGLSAATPKATPNQLMALLAGSYDVAGQTVTFQYLDGAYAGAQYQLTLQPWTGGGLIVAQGNCANNSAVTISGMATAFFTTANLPGTVQLQCMRLDAGITNQGLGVIQFSQLQLGPTASNQLSSTANGATLAAFGPYEIVGSGAQHLFTNGKGLAFNRGVAIMVKTGVSFGWFSFATGQAYNGSASSQYLSVANAGQTFVGDTHFQAVTGAVNNGSGLIRLQVASTAGFVTGNSVDVAVVGGVPNASGNWTITVISGTQVDLQGSTFAGSYTSGGTMGSRTVDGISPASTANLALGMSLLPRLLNAGSALPFYPPASITAIGPTSITLSAGATAQATAGTYFYGYVRQATTATTSAGSANVTSTGINTNKLQAGMVITAPGVPAGTTILNITGANALTMTANCTNATANQYGASTNCGAAQTMTFELATLTQGRFHAEAVSVIDTNNQECLANIALQTCLAGQFFPGDRQSGTVGNSSLAPLSSGSQLL